jgi:AbrB family looped-hinge helix DNA binding protein
MRITSKGQVTIPAAIREQAGLLPGTEVDFVHDRKTVRMVRAKGKTKNSRGARIVAHLRSHPGDINMTTEEMMALMRGDQ